MNTPDTPAKFQAGFAQRNITPPLGTILAGYFHERIGTRVRDELFAKVAAFTNEAGESVILVGLDLICVDHAFAEKAKEQILAGTGVPPERVLISATHTHTGPEVREFGAKVPVDRDWWNVLVPAIVEAVRDAWSQRESAFLRHGKVPGDGYVFNRIYRNKDGLETLGRKPGTVGPAGPVDPELGVLGAYSESGELLGCVVNIGIHTDVIGRGQADFISADWPGEIARAVAGVYGSGVVTLFLQGACGDTNQIPYHSKFNPIAGENKAVSMGRGLAGGAIFALEREEPITDSTLSGEIRKIPVAWYTRTPELMEEIRLLKQKPDLGAPEKYQIKAIEEWPHDNATAEIPLQALRIGTLSLFAVPAQIFVPIALDIKQWSPARQTMVVELANARMSSYIPTPNQAERGAYGTRPIVSRWLEVDAGRKIIDAAFLMLREIQGAGDEGMTP